MKILVSGATGFIGSHLVSRLETEHEVYALVRKRPPQAQLSKAHWIEQNLSEPLDPSVLPQQLDAVLHLAQSKFYKDFPGQAKDIYGINVQSTFEFLEYARKAGVTRFIFTSTGGLYGYSYEKFVETDPVSPLNFYFSSKYIAELLVGNYQQFFHTTVFRLFFVYGTGQTPTMLIPRLVRSVLAGEPITLEGDEGLRINPTHVSDVVTSFERALSLEGHHLINLGGPQVLSLREIASIIGKQVGRTPVFTTVAERESNHLVGDISKMSALLGEPKVPFADGVAEICAELAQEQQALGR